MDSKKEPHLLVYDYREMSFEYMFDAVNVCHKCANSSLPVLEVIGPAWKGNSNVKYCCIVSHLSEIEQYNGE